MAGEAVETAGPRLDVYGDFVCPFSWMAGPVLEQIRTELSLTVNRRAFELRPVPAPFPDEGYLRADWERSVLPIARTLGIEVRFPALRTRTRKAHEAVAFAAGRGMADAMCEAIYQGYFVDTLDIGRIEVLCRIGAGLGMDYFELRNALEGDHFTDRVLEDLERAAILGISAVPAFVLNDSSEEGATRIGWQSAADLRHWLERTLTTVME
jgi:predicted DsbA family dithiol-disulfide isomerase